jgi:hypothetical protein
VIECQRIDGCNTPVTCRLDQYCGDRVQFGPIELRGQPGPPVETTPGIHAACVEWLARSPYSYQQIVDALPAIKPQDLAAALRSLASPDSSTK